MESEYKRVSDSYDMVVEQINNFESDTRNRVCNSISTLSTNSYLNQTSNMNDIPSYINQQSFAISGTNNLRTAILETNSNQNNINYGCSKFRL